MIICQCCDYSWFLLFWSFLKISVFFSLELPDKLYFLMPHAAVCNLKFKSKSNCINVNNPKFCHPHWQTINLGFSLQSLWLMKLLLPLADVWGCAWLHSWTCYTDFTRKNKISAGQSVSVLSTKQMTWLTNVRLSAFTWLISPKWPCCHWSVATWPFQ